MLILSEPGHIDFECVQGDSFQRTETIDDDGTPVNFTGMTGALVAILDTVGKPKFELTTSGGLTLGNGTIAIAIDDAVTLTYRPGIYHYQLRVSDATDTQTWLEGNFTITERKQ